MKGSDLLILKAQLGFTSNLKLARALGISERNLYKLLLKDELSIHMALACAALLHQVEPYSPPETIPPALQLLIQAESASTLRWLEIHRLRPISSVPEGDETIVSGEPDHAVEVPEPLRIT